MDIYIARWFQLKESPGYFHARILSPIISIQGRKGDENYAIYTTISRAGGQADGVVDLINYQNTDLLACL